jgi:hypothetical protein
MEVQHPRCVYTYSTNTQLLMEKLFRVEQVLHAAESLAFSTLSFLLRLVGNKFIEFFQFSKSHFGGPADCR